MNAHPSIAPRHSADTAAPKRPKPPIPVATDTAIRMGAKDGSEVPLTYWDVWYALLAKNQFDGDLDRLAGELRRMLKGYSYSDDARRKLSHLRDLQQRLKQAGLGLADVVAAIPPELAKAEQRRAHGRIIKHNQRSYELSEPMRVLPKDRLYEAALSGMWGAFPVSPEPHYTRLRASFNWRRYYEEDDSWSLAKTLDLETASAKKLANAGKFADALAVLRGMMTVTLELAQIADDSYGCIGLSFEFAFKDYLEFPRDETGIAPETFLADLLELLVFEDFGFTYDHTEGYFAGLPTNEAEFCLDYLRGRISALMALDLDYQAEKVLTLIGQVAAEQKRFEMFEALAKEMGAREWKRIIRLADAAVRARKRDLADRVFQVALTGEDGGHHDFLSKKHAQLLQGNWNPDPRQWGTKGDAP